MEAQIAGTVKSSSSAHVLLNCVILLRNVKGRLGNHLFMFASAYGLSRTHGCLLYIEERILKDLHDIFELNSIRKMNKQDIRLLEKQNIISQQIDCRFDPKLMRPEAVKYFELTGFWQAYGYFNQHMKEIRTLLSFKPNIIRVLLPFINSLLLNHVAPDNDISFKLVKERIKMESSVTWIGIHIRRGDFLEQSALDSGRTVSSIGFLNKAISYFTRRYGNRTVFIVASDDKSYCRQIFRNRTDVNVTPDDFSPANDLAVLSLCTNVIATAGSFSWWAAVLAGGIVLHDEQFPRRNSSLEALCPRSSYYPPWFLFL